MHKNKHEIATSNFDNEEHEPDETSYLFRDSTRLSVDFTGLTITEKTFQYSNCQQFFNILWSGLTKITLKDIKCGVLFILLVVITAVLAAKPENENLYRHFSVVRWQPQNITISIPLDTVAIRIALTGYLLIKEAKDKPKLTIETVGWDCSSNGTDKCWTKEYSVDKNVSAKEVMIREYLTVPPEYRGRDQVIRLQTNSFHPMSIGINFVFLPQTVENQVIYGAVILLAVYVLIIFDIVHRSMAAAIGCLAALATMASFNLKPSLGTVISWLDFDTLTLLFGMMLIVGVFSETGFFGWVAFKAYIIAKGRPWPLLVILCSVAAVISAFLDNVTTVLLLTPVTIRLCEALKMDPKRILIAEVIFSNIGGTATAIGDPPNVILVSSNELQAHGLSFANFTLHMSIGTVFVFFVCLLFLRLLYRNLSDSIGNEDEYRIVELKREIELWRRSAYSFNVETQEEAAMRALLLEKAVNLEHELSLKSHVRRPSRHFRETVKKMEAKYVIKDKPLLVKCSLILILVIISFFLSSLLWGFYLDLGWIAFIGAVWVIILSDFENLESLFDRVEWATLIFFAALFALMHALEELGLIAWIGDNITNLVLMVPEDERLLVTIIVLLWLSSLCSSFIDNIPYTTAMIPIVLKLGNGMDLLPLVWAVAFGACLGGNGTLIGASANVVVAGVASQHGYTFTFNEFFKVGFPITIVSNIVVTVYLIICHVVIQWNS